MQWEFTWFRIFSLWSLSLCQTHLTVSHVAMTTALTPALAEVLAHSEGLLSGGECSPDDPLKLCCGSAVVLDGLLCCGLFFFHPQLCCLNVFLSEAVINMNISCRSRTNGTFPHVLLRCYTSPSLLCNSLSFSVECFSSLQSEYETEMKTLLSPNSLSLPPPMSLYHSLSASLSLNKPDSLRLFAS